MIKLTTGTKRLTIIMLAITIIGVFIAYNYYSYINSLEDPRIHHIKEMHLRYNQAVTDNKTEEAIALLDSMDVEYSKIDHYQDSFERGVVYTNLASIFITKALYQARDDAEKIKFLDNSEQNLNKSIEYFDIWKNTYLPLNNDELFRKVSEDFSEIEAETKKDIIDKRTIDISFALKEIDKRYSVVYTNMGVVMRHKLLQDSAIVFYKKALDLWKDNHTAKSNLSVLMGGEPIKRGFIEKMFPPEREEE
ncbi:MAG: hypothetical protein PF638_06355 [Candidatus Delongbacteria bacterium]|jgi:tetratricopeptide (TPR) repeat protein|nr:hypothetical protein [Candidatus Delongbacteria bacterium]